MVKKGRRGIRDESEGGSNPGMKEG